MLINTVKIGQVTLGGQPGEHPVALAGSIFYDRHKIVTDHQRGMFDPKEAAKLLLEQQKWAEATGIPAMVDIVASSKEAMVRYIDFVVEHVDCPLLLDGSSEEVRIAGLQHCQRLEITDRAVYNSVSIHSTAEELEALREAGCQTVIVLAYNPSDFSLEGRFRAAEEILFRVKAAGIPQVIVDTAVIDLPSLGMAANLIPRLKEKLGVPICNSPHNAISRWPGLKNKFQPAVAACTATAHAVSAAWGTDLLLYGPIRDASQIFPAVGLVEACRGQIRLEAGLFPGPNHPLFKMV